MSQLLWLDSLGEFLSNFVIREILNILSIIPKIIYFLVACLLSVIDMFQIVFRKLAGLDPIILNGEYMKGDSVYKIIMDALFNGYYPAIGTIFWSIIVLGVFMLIITALLATIRIEYNPDKDKGNSKAGIIKNFLTGLFSLLIIPVGSIFAMFLANSLVGVIDTITVTATADTSDLSQYFDPWTNEEVNEEMQNQYSNSYIAYDIFGISIPTTQEPFSGTVFRASAYSSNRFRLYGADYLQVINQSGTDLGLFGNGKITDSKDAARIIDSAFASNAKIKKGVENDLIDFTRFDWFDGDNNRDYYTRGVLGLFGHLSDVESFSKYNVEMVWYFYNLWTFNYIVGFVGVIALGKLYATFCLMLMSRIFEIISLFIFAPIVVGIMPIDNGAALQRWRLHYSARFGLVLIMVFGMNMVSPIISVLGTIKFFGEPLLDYIVLTIMIVAAMSAVNSLNSVISTILFDKATAYESSMKTAEATSANLKQGVNTAKTAAKIGAAPVAIPAKLAAKGIGKGIANKIERSRASRIAARREGFDADERTEAAKGVAYSGLNKSSAEATYGSMHSDDRKNLADDFLATDAGKEWAHKYFSDDLSKAKDAIAYDLKTGVHRAKGIEGSTTLTNAEKLAAREQITQFMFDKDNFEKSKTAEGLTKGTAEYNKALNDYYESSTMDKAQAHVGGIALNATQENVQRQRQSYEGQLQEKERNRQKRRDFFGKVSSGAQEHLGPVAGGLQSLINLIPGMGLFEKPKKDDKKK